MPANDMSDQSIGELVKRLSEETSTLVRQELALAKAEMAEKGKHFGLGGGMLGAAGVLGIYKGGALVATLILILIEVGVDPWLSALIVTAVLGLVAAVLALAGRQEMQKATPPTPKQAVASTKQDVDYLKQRARRHD